MKQKLSKDGIFIFNERQKELLEIEPEVRLKVIDAMFAYNLYGELPTDPILKAYFGRFKKDIDDGKAKKKDISDKRKEAIAKRWGNKPIESLEEEKGTEIPNESQGAEFEPMVGQEIDNLETDKDMGNFVGYVKELEPSIVVREAPKEEVKKDMADIPQPLYEVISQFFKEREWLLTQRHSFKNMVNANSKTFEMFTSAHNIDYGTIEAVWNNLKKNIV